MEECQEDVSIEAAIDHAEALRREPCPKCGRQDGTVELRASHFIWSYLKSYSGTVEWTLYCRGCGKQANLTGIAGSLIVGWWSVPGLFLTPVFVARNIGEIRRFDRATSASPGLVAFARFRLAEALYEGSVPDDDDLDERRTDGKPPG